MQSHWFEYTFQPVGNTVLHINDLKFNSKYGICITIHQQTNQSSKSDTKFQIIYIN